MRYKLSFDRRWLAFGVFVGIGIGVALAGRTRPGAPKPPHDASEQDGAIVPPLDKPTADRIARHMEADPALKGLLAICPADAWRRRGDLTHSPPITPAACAKTPDTCLADCLEFSSGHACYALARVMQKTREADPLTGETLYQLACAAGDESGCVNRAAGLRNTHFAGDPYPKVPAAAREACQLKSFAIGCDADDPWGCAMRGQAYALGEGTPADAAAARRDYAKACAKDQKFAACGFAKGGLAEMEKPGAAAGDHAE